MEKINAIFAKLPFKGLAEKFIPAGARAKVPFLETIVIPFANQIVCGLIAILLVACIPTGGRDGASGSSGSPARNAAPNAESDFTVVLTQDHAGAIITRYTGTRANVVIPATIQGLPVREIGAQAFAVFQTTSITSVVIPEGVVRIGERAFQDRGQLASVTLPSTLVSIEISAFSECRALTSIALPANLRYLGYHTFNSSGLTAFPNPWPAAITSIPRGTFSYTNLGVIVIPEGITGIGDSAFSNAGLTSVTLPSTIRTFGNFAFSNNPNLSLASQTAIRQAGYTGRF